MADQDTIDSYDNLAGKWAEVQRGKGSFAHEYLEKPAMYAKLPDLKGKSVLCIGCGSGEECAYIKEQGAARVVGIDISKGLIEQAKYTYPDCEFLVMDMERMDFDAQSFDFVYSSLALHYAENWQTVLLKVKEFLKPDGVFLFSTHHPVKWGAQIDKNKEAVEVKLGYIRREDGGFEVFGDYLNARAITENLRKDLRVTYYHKPFGEIFRIIKASGFIITDLLEPIPQPQTYKEKPDYRVHEKIPLFLIIEVRPQRHT